MKDKEYVQETPHPETVPAYNVAPPKGGCFIKPKTCTDTTFIKTIQLYMHRLCGIARNKQVHLSFGLKTKDENKDATICR